MAYSDKLQAPTKRAFVDFYRWANMMKDICYKETQQNIMECFITTPEEFDTHYTCYTDPTFSVAMFSKSMERWLYKHCPIKYVRDFVYPGNLREKDIELYLKH